MPLVKKLKTFSDLSLRTKWLFIKAIFISLLVRTIFSFFSFRRVLKWLGEVNVESEKGPNDSSLKLRNEIKAAIVLCNKYVFWKTECYNQSLTAKILLKQYRVPSTLYIGFCKDEGNNYKGHAWLRSYDLIVTGNADLDKYKIQSFFT